MRRSFLVWMACAGCPAPSDYTPQIPVQPGVAARASFIQRYDTLRSGPADGARASPQEATGDVANAPEEPLDAGDDGEDESRRP